MKSWTSWISGRHLAIAAVLLVVVATIGGAAAYHWQLRPGLVVMSFGWLALFGTGYFLYRAAATFDAAPGEEVETADRLAGVRRDDLLMEKRHLLKAIKEIEFDHDMGKIDDRDAEEVVRRYRARAVEIMRALDDQGEQRYQAMAEKELARRLAVAGDEAQPTVARSARCPSCDAHNDSDAKFCKACGTKIA
jgi:zinc ribbon protein